MKPHTDRRRIFQAAYVSNDDSEEADVLSPLAQEEVMTLEEKARLFDLHSRAANQLSVRLLNSTTEEEERRVLHQSLDLSLHVKDQTEDQPRTTLKFPICTMIFLVVLFFVALIVLIIEGIKAVGPPNRPVGPYELVERQVSHACIPINDRK
jgi:hypothetical protein